MKFISHAKDHMCSYMRTWDLCFSFLFALFIGLSLDTTKASSRSHILLSLLDGILNGIGGLEALSLSSLMLQFEVRPGKRGLLLFESGPGVGSP